VIGVPDARRGSAVKAFVLLAGDAAATDALRDELRALVAEKVGRHAVPRQVEFVDELPRTISGKLQRAELRRRETTGPASG
jgi:acetyl-CoA synthetase